MVYLACRYPRPYHLDSSVLGLQGYLIDVSLFRCGSPEEASAREITYIVVVETSHIEHDHLTALQGLLASGSHADVGVLSEGYLRGKGDLVSSVS